MSKNTKTVFRAFDYMHCDDFAKFLMDMAAKGWHFKEWGVGLKFEKGEPEQAVYVVEVFTDASEYDLRPEPNTTLNFAEYCREAGWELVDAKRKFCIFKKVQEDAVAILTPEERVENVIKESRAQMYWPLVVSMSFVFMQMADYFNGENFNYQIFSAFELSMTLFWTMALLHEAVKCIVFLCKKHKMKRKLANGEEVYIGDGKRHPISHWSLALVVFAAVVGFALVPMKWMLPVLIFSGATIFIFLVAAILLAKFRPDSDTNYIVQAVLGMVYVVAVLIFAVCWGLEENETATADVPLKKADYMEAATEISSIDLYEDSNILGSRQVYVISHEYVEGEESHGLIYQKYTSEIDWILDRIWKVTAGETDDVSRVDCTKEWNAKNAFCTGNKYFVQYEDIIFIFSDYEERVLTQDQIDVIREKMDLR